MFDLPAFPIVQMRAPLCCPRSPCRDTSPLELVLHMLVAMLANALFVDFQGYVVCKMWALHKYKPTVHRRNKLAQSKENETPDLLNGESLH